jgi:RNA polymerase sigma factor (sigma-70 family)
MNQDDFDRLLNWLDPDKEGAGLKYEDIRRRLIKIFIRRGCVIPEELTDETIDRVARKLKEKIDTYQGEPAHYFCGFARNVFHEYLEKMRREAVPPPPADPPEIVERKYECLSGCMNLLDPEDRDLILSYYCGDKRAKIERRRELAEQLGITVNTLRMRVHRLKATLKACVMDCVCQAEANCI